MSVSAEKHGSLIEALLAFHAEAPDLHKDKANGAFKGVKYLSLDGLTDAVRPLLVKHGLVWVAIPDSLDDGSPALSYQLMHVTGEVIRGRMPLVMSKQDAQGQGSALTYARRYSLMSVLNLVADEDDDGNAASTKPAQKTANGNGGPKASGADIAEMVRASEDLDTDQIKLALAACGIPGVKNFGEVPAGKVVPLVKAFAGIQRQEQTA